MAYFQCWVLEKVGQIFVQHSCGFVNSGDSFLPAIGAGDCVLWAYPNPHVRIPFITVGMWNVFGEEIWCWLFWIKLGICLLPGPVDIADSHESTRGSN